MLALGFVVVKLTSVSVRLVGVLAEGNSADALWPNSLYLRNLIHT